MSWPDRSIKATKKSWVKGKASQAAGSSELITSGKSSARRGTMAWLRRSETRPSSWKWKRLKGRQNIVSLKRKVGVYLAKITSDVFEKWMDPELSLNWIIFSSLQSRLEMSFFLWVEIYLSLSWHKMEPMRSLNRLRSHMLHVLGSGCVHSSCCFFFKKVV